MREKITIKVAKLYKYIIDKSGELTNKQKKILTSSLITALILIPALTFAANNVTDKDVIEEACAVAINGNDLLYVMTEKDAESVIAGVISAYVGENSEVTEYWIEEDITYETKDIVTAKEAKKDDSLTETYICTVEEAITYIINGTTTPITYIVQEGDTLWDIAIANNISAEELQSMNPGKLDFISIGEEINLYKKTPVVNVSTKAISTYSESIPYGTSYVNNANMYKGETKVQTKGTNGSKEIKVEIVKTNGVEVSRLVLEETVISQPVEKVVEKGTKSIPISTGSGLLSNPLPGYEISSGYGASRGRRTHKGIDIRAPRGTAFKSADSGTVTYAGWNSSYGYIIVVNHGNGIQTKYAHCNSMSVKAGENVKKGQILGTVGNTGNATGNVLHFEVVVNGVSKNPTNYI